MKICDVQHHEMASLVTFVVYHAGKRPQNRAVYQDAHWENGNDLSFIIHKVMTQEEQYPHFVSFTNYTDFFFEERYGRHAADLSCTNFYKKQEGHVVKL